ncbi:hypothetical protein HRbin36_00464 [bacterium HR36]|nr:hypothetical protein HRbin36_00464 [bacterium HR36]
MPKLGYQLLALLSEAAQLGVFSWPLRSDALDFVEPIHRLLQLA